MQPILFFDHECGFCRYCVFCLSEYMKNDAVYFAPLKGITASKFLKKNETRSLVYIDPITQKIHRRFEAIFLFLSHHHQFFYYFRWLAIFLNPIYSLIAISRKWIPVEKIQLKGPKFLP